MTELVEWLAERVQEKGWSNNELARRSGLSSSAVSLVMTGQQTAGMHFCVGVAKGLTYPPEKVLRIAGLLPRLEVEEERREELLGLFEQMTPATREHFMLIARAFAEGRLRRGDELG